MFKSDVKAHELTFLGEKEEDLGFWGRVIPVDGNGGPAEMYLSCFL